MKYHVQLNATVEAVDAEAAKKLFNNMDGATYDSIDVTPLTQWIVSVSVPVMYTVDFTVNAETADDAEQIATEELDCVIGIEDFDNSSIVSDYQYDIDAGNIEVQNVEAIEDDDEETDEPATAIAP